MKLKLKHIRLGILGILLIVVFSTQLFSNFWSVLTVNGFIIPKESSYFSFKSTEMNGGNGEYWLYGKDENYFYSKMKFGISEPYIKISKKQAENIEIFDEKNYKTWDDTYLCEDLLKIYADKPNELEFIKCEIVENSQTLVKATYRVSGKKSKEIETFFVNNYGMGKLKWVCCGWEIGGKYGSFESEELTKIHPFLTNIITMYSSVDENESLDGKLEFDRNKIKYFTITVELVIV